MNMHLIRRSTTGAILTAAAAAALSAGPAQASLGVPCSGSSIHGEGDQLQARAQGIWTGAVGTVGFNRNTNGGCVAGVPRATYTPTTTALCQVGRWGADGLGPFTASVQFCGTDQAPTSTQLANLNTNLRASALTIPVAQAAIAIVVNPPSGCSISTISAANLELVFRGSTTAWSSIGTGSGCTGQTITRVVRTDTSGTTYQLKHFLFAQNNANVCSARPATTWADLQQSTLNTVWPATCDGPPSTGVVYSQQGCPSLCAPGGRGEADEAKTIKATNGSIGYVTLSDARAQYTGSDRYKWLRLSVGMGVGVDPSTNGLSVTAAKANCTTTATAYGTTLPSATSSWTSVYLTNPGTAYSLCMLTWALASSDYSQRTDWTVGGVGVTGRNAGTTVHDYLGYVVTTPGGQADALGGSNDYQVLPNAGGGSGDVQAAARAGVAQIID